MRYLSLCSGIEAASVAWQPLGWTPVAFAEIDPFCCALLAHYWPDVPNLGDVTKIKPRDLKKLGPIDLVVGGTPCQDLSVAGKRSGIRGTRSSLFFDYVRVFHAARRFCGARFALWENVPNALINRGGRDFAVVVSEFAGLKLDPPRGGWGNEGLALGKFGLVEWGVLDAQWFGVAQRRQRLFALLDTGSWQDRAPVLLEPEGLRGDSPPSRAPGARTSGTLTARALDGSSACGGDGRAEGFLVASEVVAAPLTHGGHPGSNKPGRHREDDFNIVAATLTASGKRQRHDETYVAGPLLSNSNGHGWRTGAEEAAGNHLIVDDVADPLTAYNSRNASVGGNNARPRNVVATVAGSLRAAGHDASEDGAGRQTLVACFDETQLTHPENRSTCSPDTAAVRRLIPVECERLMGLPDNFTRIPYKPRRRKLTGPAKDTIRYAALGNSIAEPHLAWIGRKLEAVLRAATPRKPRRSCK